MSGETGLADRARLEAKLRELAPEPLVEELVKLSPESLARWLYLLEQLRAYEDEVHQALSFAQADPERMKSLEAARDAAREKGQNFFTCVLDWYDSVTAGA